MWLETDNYIFTVKKKILLSDIEWLNDHIMDNLKSYQSVLN